MGDEDESRSLLETFARGTTLQFDIWITAEGSFDAGRLYLAKVNFERCQRTESAPNKFNSRRSQMLLFGLLARFLDQSLGDCCWAMICDVMWQIQLERRASTWPLIFKSNQSFICSFASRSWMLCYMQVWLVLCDSQSNISHDAISELSHNRRISSRCSQTNSEASDTYCASTI